MKKVYIITAIVMAVLVAILAWLMYMYNKVKTAATNPNVQAFLKMLRYAEGTSGPDGYRTVYGGTLISNLSDHPYYTGEWKGKILPDVYCKNAGLSPGCKSTAAGAYQITKGTWLSLKYRLGLQDFSAESQDLAAIELIRQKGALEDIEAGNIPSAISKVSVIWASLPGSASGQPQKTLAQLQAVYQSDGGNLA